MHPPDAARPPVSGIRRLKRQVRQALERARGRYVRTFHAFGVAELEAALRGLGLGPGQCVMVHSSWDAFQGFSGKPTDVIALLQRILGESGLLVLPTLPFSGTAVAWAEGDPVFDPARTPSRMGLLTEMFRRMPGVQRSLHPTHPVAAWGAQAAQFVEGHHLCGTPCGRGSPYARLLERDGRILLLGADVTSLTFFHTVEELLEAQFPVSPFTKELWRLRSRAPDGSVVVTETRLFEPSVSRRRNLTKLVPWLGRAGAWHETRVGRLTAILLDAGEVLRVIEHMAREGVYCYD